MWCKKQQSSNAERCYHTSSVTHLSDVFWLSVHTCSLYTRFFGGFFFKSVQLDAVFDEGQRLALTETLWMRYKTDHMVACCTTNNSAAVLCVRPAARVKVPVNSCQLFRLCDVYFRCMVSVSRRICSDHQANHTISPHTVGFVCPEGHMRFCSKQMPGAPLSVSTAGLLFSLEAFGILLIICTDALIKPNRS